MSKCPIEGCTRSTRNPKCKWCRTHYRKFLKYGDPEAGWFKGQSATAAAKALADEWKPGGLDLSKPCREDWEFARQRDGRPHVWSTETGTMSVARAILIYGGADMADDTEASHECQNKLCIEPAHILPLPRSFHRSRDNALRHNNDDAIQRLIKAYDEEMS